jgi:hypothetical protein
MIPFGIGLFGHHQNRAGAEFNAKTTAFASLFNDMNNTMGNLNVILI